MIKKENFISLFVDMIISSNYWAEADLENLDSAGESMWAGKGVEITDIFTKKKHILNRKKVMKGINLNLVNRPWDADISNPDWATCDCILQYAIFGNVVYG